MSVIETSSVSSGSTYRAPLSLHQRFICIFDKGDAEGPFGPKYSVNFAWRVDGEVDIAALQGALDDIVVRHEALRTEIVRDEADPHQRILPPASPRLTVRDMPGGDAAARHRQVEDLLDEIENDDFSVREMPQLRAVLGRFDERDSILVLVAHHAAADGWSMQRLIRDLATCYAARRGLDVPELPEARQYREFVQWEQEIADAPATRRAREYWRENYGDAQVTAVGTDWPRSAGRPKGTSWYRFVIPGEQAAPALEFARSLRASPFMVFLAAFQVLLRKQTGQSDIVVPTFSPGRGRTRFPDTVGNFHNFLPVRTNLDGCETFRDVATRTRAACLASYSNELEFIDIVGLVPGLMAPVAGDDVLMCALQVLGSEHAPDSEEIGDLRYSEVRRRLQPQEQGIDIPEGALWTLDVLPSGEIIGNIGFNNNRWAQATMEGLVAAFSEVLQAGVSAPDAPLNG
jgi:hypothetical protein